MIPRAKIISHLEQNQLISEDGSDMSNNLHKKHMHHFAVIND